MALSVKPPAKVQPRPHGTITRVLDVNAARPRARSNPEFERLRALPSEELLANPFEGRLQN